MTRAALSAAGAGLLRALLARAGAGPEELRLRHYRSTEWSSLTFVGERHEMELEASGPDASGLADRLADNLGDAEFSIPGQIVADIALTGPLDRHHNNHVLIPIEALTVSE